MLLASGTLLAQGLPDASTSGIDAVKKWAFSRLQPAERDFGKSGQRQASPSFWGNQVVYQIQVDRFNNGSFANDNLNIEDEQKRYQDGSDLHGLPNYRHGGDLKGIIDRLDYIKDMGVTSLWLTPVFKHNGSYHGYCTTDFTEVDPGFGTKEELRELVAKAHSKGIKVILDIVVNHMCDKNTIYLRNADHYKCANDLSSTNWSGASGGSAGQGELEFGKEFFPPFKGQNFFNRCGANTQSDMEGTGPAAVYGDFVSVMFDFDTRNHDFQQVFTDLHKYWIAYADIDGYRMDAAKHITEDFVAYFNTHIRAYARVIGKNNFFIVGEVAGPSDWIGRMVGKMYSNPHNPNDRGNVPQALTSRLWQLKDIYLSHPQAPYPGLSAAYNFGHGGTALDVLMGKRPTSALEDFFRGDYMRTLAGQNDIRLNWNLLEIHDWPRFSSRDKKNPYKSMLGISYLATAEGSPIIYYGQEQGLNGDCHFDNMNAGSANQRIKQECKGQGHELYRQDMFMNGPYRLGSTVNEIDNLAYIGKMSKKGPVTWTRDPYLNRNHMVFKLARKMLHVRKSCNALSYGFTKFRWVDNHNDGLLAFSRIDNGNEVLVVMNTGPHELRLMEIEIGNNSNGQKWVNLLNAHENAWTNGRGKLDFNGQYIKGNSTMVLVHHSQVSEYNSYLETHLCKDNL